MVLVVMRNLVVRERGMSIRLSVYLRAKDPLPTFEWPEWRDLAACKGKSDIFLVGDTQVSPRSGPANKFDRMVTQRAKAVCNTCSVADECLHWALSERIPFFVYGGLSWPERQKLLRRKSPILIDGGSDAVAQ